MDHDDTSCNRCGDTYELRPGCEPTPECDSCAHIALAEARASIAAIHCNVHRSDVDRAVLLSIRDECERCIPALKDIRP